MQRNYEANGHMHYSISALVQSPHSRSFSLFHFHILLCSGTERWEKFPHIMLCSSRNWVQYFYFFSSAEAGSHFISLIISLSTTSHEGISNKYFLPFVVGLFFRSASYSPIFYIPSASLPCKVQQWLYSKFLWDPVSDVKLSFWTGKPIEIFHPKDPPNRVMRLFWVRVIRIKLVFLSEEI